MPHMEPPSPQWVLTCSVEVQWASAPGQWVLEGIEEEPQDPQQNGVVVQADQEGH